ncbi:MAG: hypothetical protein ACRBFS_06210 [Aureispira sp.]
MTTYKPHYACFSCQKTFKRRLLRDIKVGIPPPVNKIPLPAKCPNCGQLMADMGLDFKAPKSNQNKAWQHLAKLYEVDITFHSCGCSGPGYVPRNQQELIQHFEIIKERYLAHQHFWARRQEDPQGQAAVAKDQHQNGSFIYSLPISMRKGSKNSPQYDATKAQVYWAQKVQEVERKIRLVLNND